MVITKFLIEGYYRYPYFTRVVFLLAGIVLAVCCALPLAGINLATRAFSLSACRRGPCTGGACSCAASAFSYHCPLKASFQGRIQKKPEFFELKLSGAEREGFEPPDAFTSTVFKTAVIDHSTTSPVLNYLILILTKRSANL